MIRAAASRPRILTTSSRVRYNAKARKPRHRELSLATPAPALSNEFAPELVIFDKDGTLIDFKYMWGAWAEQLCQKMQDSMTLDTPGMTKFADKLGYCRESGTVSNTSPLCCTPMHQIEDICVNTIEEHNGVDNQSARTAVKKVWGMPDPTETVKPLTDLPDLFSYLKKDLKMKIAVCTTDDRDVTEETLDLLLVDGYVDTIVCGDDLELPPKPSPEQIWHICDKLGVSHKNTVMVGDTVTDMTMGNQANVGFNVGIRNGAGTIDDLSEHADVILPSLDRFAKVITHMSKNRLEK